MNEIDTEKQVRKDFIVHMRRTARLLREHGEIIRDPSEYRNESTYTSLEEVIKERRMTRYLEGARAWQD